MNKKTYSNLFNTQFYPKYFRYKNRKYSPTLRHEGKNYDKLKQPEILIGKNLTRKELKIIDKTFQKEIESPSTY